MNTLSNVDIINIINQYDLNYCFGGVYSKDKLPLLKPNTFYIINLEDHKGLNHIFPILFSKQIFPNSLEKFGKWLWKKFG
jgi:hypothetical protein